MLNLYSPPRMNHVLTTRLALAARARYVPATLGAALLVAALGCETNITDSDIRFVRVAEVRDLTSRQARSPEGKLVALIDPRASKAFDAGHLPGARNLKLPQVPERSSTDPELSAFKHIVVYGDNPGSVAARAMTKRMMAVGYKGVRLFAGGVEEWRSAGYETEGTPADAELPPETPAETPTNTPAATPEDTAAGAAPKTNNP